MCSSLCNDSILQYNPDKDSYEKIGESTEVALRVLAEKVRLSVNSFLCRICFHKEKIMEDNRVFLYPISLNLRLD